MDATEGRVLALQRIAYGADATDAERARAVAELAELGELTVRAAGSDTAGAGEDRDDGERGGPGAGDGAGAGEGAGAGAGAGAGEGAAGETDPAGEQAPNDDASTRGRLVRWTAVAGGVGLLFGAALGWAAGQRVPVDSAASMVSAAPSEEPGTPLEDSDLLPLFDRLPLADESARVASIDDVIDPASVRLLATRVDGPAAYLARTADGENVCLVLLLPAGPSRIECTVDGLLPADGLSILYGAQGYGLAAARLATTGTVSLGLIVTF